MIAEAAGTATALYGLGKKIFGGNSDEKQLEQQKELNQNQYEHNVNMADTNRKYALQMWKDTGYEAQREQMEAAGLNTGLMYGMGGGGGQTANNGGGGQGVSGAQASGSAERDQASLGMALAGAQVAALQSQANKNNAEAELTRGAGTAETAAKAANLTEATKLIGQQIKNAGLEAVGQSLQNRFDEIRNEIADAGSPYQIESIKIGTYKAQKEFNILIQKLREANVDANVKEKAENTIVEQYNANVKNTMADVMLKQGMSSLTEEQAKKVAADIQQKWVELQQNSTNIEYQHGDRQKGMETDTKNTEEMAKAIMISAGIGAAGAIAGKISDIVSKSGTVKGIKGFLPKK